MGVRKKPNPDGFDLTDFEWWGGEPPRMPDSHDALAHDLACYLGKPDLMACGGKWLTWENVTMRDGCRPDVYAMEACINRRPESRAYEVKFTRSDFLKDIKSGKYKKYEQFADRCFFAAPKGLIDKKEVPEGFGLMERSENGWNMSKRASKKTIKYDIDLFHILVIRDRNRAPWKTHNLRWEEHKKGGHYILKKDVFIGFMEVLETYRDWHGRRISNEALYDPVKDKTTKNIIDLITHNVKEMFQ